MNTGIYAIEHIASGRKYIGSAVDFAARWRVHLHHLRKGKHHSPRLQNAWNKYGEVAFAFRKLLICSKDNLLLYEQRCLDGYRAIERAFGYNTFPTAGSSAGMKHSDEARAKIRARRATQVFSAETRALWSKNRTGRKMPDGFGSRVTEWKTGTTHTSEARAKISAAHRGRMHLDRRGKVSLADANEIRALYAAGRKQDDIAAQYGICQSHVSKIVSNSRRTH